MTALTATDRGKLLKLLALLSSDHAGERDGAALAAMRLLHRTGLSWDDILARAAPVLPRHPPSASWRDLVATCLRQPGTLRAWEQSFLRSLLDFRKLSPKQAAVLRDIAERLGVLEAT